MKAHYGKGYLQFSLPLTVLHTNFEYDWSHIFWEENIYQIWVMTTDAGPEW